MSIDIKAPLADRLFALGTTTGAPGKEQFKYQGRKPSGFNIGQAPQVQQQGQQKDNNGQMKALGSVFGALASNYLGGAAAPTEPAADYSLGGNLDGTRSNLFTDFKYGGPNG